MFSSIVLLLLPRSELFKEICVFQVLTFCQRVELQKRAVLIKNLYVTFHCGDVWSVANVLSMPDDSNHVSVLQTFTSRLIWFYWYLDRRSNTISKIMLCLQLYECFSINVWSETSIWWVLNSIVRRRGIAMIRPPTYKLWWLS